MKRRIRIIISIIVLLAIFVCVFTIASRTLMPQKGNYYDIWDEYYRMDDGSIDILFLGSSHAFSTFNTLVINKELNLDTYSLSTSSQPIELTYYVLNEALKTQNPKMVVLETQCFINDLSDTNIHYAIDDMNLSTNKIKAILEYRKDMMGEYIVPLAKHHSNWRDYTALPEELKAAIDRDIVFTKYYGYKYDENVWGLIENDYFINNYDIEPLEFNSDKKDALERIVNLCEENDIKIVFVMAPFPSGTNVDSHSAYFQMTALKKGLEGYMDKHNIDIIDYNCKIEELGLDTTKFLDSRHVNPLGAMDVSLDFSKYISENYSGLFETCKWDYKEESTKKYIDFQTEYQKFLLKRERLIKEYKVNFTGYQGNLAEYLAQLDDPKYITMIVSQNNNYEMVNHDIYTAFENLGISADFANKEKSNYIAVKYGNKIYTQKQEGEIIYDNENDILGVSKYIDDIRLISSDNSMIMLSGEKAIECIDGFNIVVYDTYLERVVSSKSFNTNIEPQFYFDRYAAQSKYENSSAKTTIEINKDIIIPKGDEKESLGYSEKVLIAAKWNGAEQSSIVVQINVEASNAAILQLNFDNGYERAQIVTGENEIYIEINAGMIENLSIQILGSDGKYEINSVDIAKIEH